MIRPVVQDERTGFGIGAAAADAVRSACLAGTKPFRSWTGLPDCALLAIKWHLEQGRPFWHWVVFGRENDRSYVVDSTPTLKAPLRTDFGRMRPVWFLSVTMKR